MGESEYRIKASFTGLSGVLGGLQTIQREVKKTSRTIVESSKAEMAARREARAKEREANREYQQALREKVRAHRRMIQEQNKLQQEDIRNQRRYLSTLKKQEHELRESRSRAIKVAGIGAAGVVGTAGGLKVAADFESSLADLKASIQEMGKGGAVDMAKLNSEMAELEALGVRLGNRLPGTTSMYLTMFRTLKEGGLDVRTIIEGAGEAVANLAVATSADPSELAKDLAQYGQQFQLAAKDYVELANLFAKIKAGTGLESGPLIEGSKYFQLRAGAPLGLKGLEGATQGAQLMAAVKELGLEGTVGGTGLSNFFSEIAKKKKLAALKKNFGIDLKFFDKKGNFLGLEHAFRQMEKFRPLSAEKRMNALNQLAGDQGMAAGQAMIDKGADGWARIIDKIERASDLQSSINTKIETFANKLEAAIGTGENLVARTFTPLMNSLKEPIDLVNKLLGATEGFAKEHRTISLVATSLLGTGSAAMVAYGGIRMATTSVRLFSLASKIAKNENYLGELMRGTARDATRAADAVGGSSAQGKWKRAGARMGGAFTTALKGALAVIAIEAIVGDIADRGFRAVEQRRAKAEIDDLLKQREVLVREADKVRGTVGSGEGLAKLGEIQKQIDELDKQIGEKRVEKVSATSTADTVPSRLMGLIPGEPSTFAANVARANKLFGRQGKWEMTMNLLEGMVNPKTPGAKISEAKDAVKADIRGLNFTSLAQLQGWLDAIRKSGAFREDEMQLITRLAGEVYPHFADSLRETGKAADSAAQGIQNLNNQLRFFNFPLFPTPPPTPQGPVKPASFVSPTGINGPGAGALALSYQVAIKGGSQEDKATFAEMLAEHRRDIMQLLDTRRRQQMQMA